MNYVIGSARVDERGRYTGGKRGDQTGKEVATENMYNHSLGWLCLRAKDAQRAQAIASAMRSACANNHIGYSQSDRLDIMAAGIDSTRDTNCDCSSLIRAVVKHATGMDAGNFTTASERTMLMNTNMFDNIGYVSTGSILYEGDILITRTKGHTAIVTSGNSRTPAATIPAQHVQLNYHVGQTYYLASTMNVRTRNAKGELKVDPSTLLYRTLKRGTAVVNQATTRDDDGRIWMYIGSEKINGKWKEKWIVADSGTTCYAQEGRV